MKAKILILVSLLFLCGCVTVNKPYVLTESETYYFIPSGTEFNAVLVKDEAPVSMTSPLDMYAVSAGYLAELQEQANAGELTPP